MALFLRYWFLWFLILPGTLLAQQGERISPTLLESTRRAELIRILRERQIPFEERPLFAMYGGFSSSVHVVIPRSITPESDRAAKTLVLGIPLSNTEDRQNQSLEVQFPFDFEIGLAFIEEIRSQGSSMDIRVAFLGDEISRLPMDKQQRSHRGLEDLYATLDDPENTILLYLDIQDAPQSLVIHHGARKTITALNVVEPLYKLCNVHKIPCSFGIWFNELYKLGLVSGHPGIQSAHEQGIHALYVTGSSSKPLAEEGSLLSREAITGLLVDYAYSLKLSTENLDYHFLILHILGTYFFISESVIIILLFLIIGTGFLITLIYSGVYRKILIIQWKVFIRYGWIFVPFLTVIPFATLWLAGVLVSQMVHLFGVSPLIKTFGMAGFKIVIAMLLFSWVFILPNLFKIPRKANLYGNTAILLVTFGVLIGALLDITLVPLFLWIFLFTFLGATIKKPLGVYLCAFCNLSLLFAFIILTTDTGGLPVRGPFSFLRTLLFSTGRLSEIILSQDMVSLLYIVVITLPFVLLLERGIALSQRRKKAPSLSRRIFPPLLLLFISLGTLASYAYILSKIPSIATERRTGDPDMLHIQYKSITFLERRNLLITVAAQGTPLRFNLYLITEDESLPVIYAAPMPFIADDDRKSVEFILGEGPPNPFTTEIVLPLSFSGSLRVEAIYTLWDPRIDPLPSPETDDYFLEVSKTIPLLD